ncbi:MAG: SMI1/KNR4 family protein [Ruminococcus sp.]|nr:SMI1/KNR4 family protein [Ruminococcus sp.]
MENQLERIKSKLIERLRENSDGEEEVYLETLPIEKITEFENKYQIKLPQGIVDFYTKVSNGAVLYPDEKICNLDPFENWHFDKNSIHTDFNIENDVTYDDYCDIKKSTKDYSFESCGNIELMYLGCAMTYNIVVKGKHYGEIIALLEMYLEITNKNFLEWIEGCIDGTEEYML